MRLKRTVLTALLGFGLLAPAALPAMAADTDLDSGLNLGTGVTVHTQQHLLQEGAKDNCLAAIKKYRQEALNENIQLHFKGGDKALKDYLGEKNITEDAYLSPKWSLALEKIAIARSAETAVHGKIARKRLNNGNWDSLSANKINATIESLAWLKTETCESAVQRWASKKANYLAQKSPYLDYSFLINPDIQTYGIAGVKSTENSNSQYAVWVGEATNKASESEEAFNQSGLIDVPLNVTEAAATEAAKKATLEQSEIKVGETFTPQFTGTVLDKVKVTYSGKLTSADSEIAKVNEDGTVEGVKAGSVELTLTTADGVKVTGTLTVVATETSEESDPAATDEANTSTDTEEASPADNDAATEEAPKTSEKTPEIKKSPSLAKTGVAFTFMSGAAALLLLGAGISIRKYASLKK